MREIHTLKQDQGGREHATLTKLQQKLGTYDAWMLFANLCSVCVFMLFSIALNIEALSMLFCTLSSVL